MTKYVPVRVHKSSAKSLALSAPWRRDFEIVSQFLWSADGGEEGKTRCITLQNAETGEHVGFLGLTLSTEDLDSVVNVFVSIEFVYLHDDCRGRGLTAIFVRWVTEQVVEWLNAGASEWIGREVVLYSASNPKSDSGEAFIKRLEHALRPVASAQHLSFTSALDDEG